MILALAGTFDEGRAAAKASTADLAATIRYPTRLRYRQLNAIEVWVENRSAARIDNLTISLDSAYANRFSRIHGIPSFHEPYRLALTDVEPGERRRALIELQAERYGRHEGTLSISARDTARVQLRTIVFP